MLKRTSLLFLLLIMIIPVKGSAFNDLNNHWAKDDIETLAQADIISGYSDQTYRPDNPVKRDEFICMVMRLIEDQLGRQEYEAIINEAELGPSLAWEEEFDQVYNSLYLPDTYWAKKNIMEAVAFRLLPYQQNSDKYLYRNDYRLNISRGEAAYILNRAAQYFGLYADRMLHYYLRPLVTDVPASYAYSTAILDALSLGIMSGYGDNTLKPQLAVNRGEAAAMLIKLYDFDRLEPFTPQGVPFVILNNLDQDEESRRYYPPLVNNEPLHDVLHLIQVLQKGIKNSDGYIQLTYNPENAVLGLEFYNTEDDYLALRNSSSQESYIKTLPLTMYLTFTISPENISRYSTDFRKQQHNSKYNPYLLISWGNGFEQDILDNHLTVLEDCFSYLFGADGDILISNIVRYLTSGQGGLTTYQSYNGRYASWKPIGDGVFVIEIMEKQ